MIEKHEFTEWLNSPVTKNFLETCRLKRDAFRECLEKQHSQANTNYLKIGFLIGSIDAYKAVMNTSYEGLELEDIDMEDNSNAG